jgi:hypothetical protein
MSLYERVLESREVSSQMHFLKEQNRLLNILIGPPPSIVKPHSLPL